MQKNAKFNAKCKCIINLTVHSAQFSENGLTGLTVIGQLRKKFYNLSQPVGVL